MTATSLHNYSRNYLRTDLLQMDASLGPRTVDVEIVVPVYNEERALVWSINRLHRYLTDRFPLSWLVTVADNASTDHTWGLACHLAQQLPGVRAVRIDQKGRGRALRAVWAESHASVVAYTDVDLSTNLDALLPLVAPLVSGHSDLAIGSRLAHGAQVVRGPRRELISRIYNVIVRTAFRNSFTDAQCGFKAARADVARALLPLIEDNGWFFDTELLVLAERNGLRIHEVPVDWIDDPDSRVDVMSTACDDLKGIARVLRSFMRGDGVAATTPGRAIQPNATSQIIHFAGIGALSTVSFALVFGVLYGALGAVGADVVALALCGAANLAANRRFTFSVRGRAGRVRHYGIGSIVSVLPLVTTLSALAALAMTGVSGLGVAVLVLTGANLTATGARFLLLRHWVFAVAAGGGRR